MQSYFCPAKFIFSFVKFIKFYEFFQILLNGKNQKNWVIAIWLIFVFRYILESVL